MQTAGPAFTKERLLSLIFDLYPWTRGFRHGRVRDYAAALFEITPKEGCEARKNAQMHLRAWIGQKARQRGFKGADVRDFETEIAAAPVLQTGPHLHLLLESDAFYTHLFSLMGLKASGRRSYVSYACSTVRLTERSRKGPGWLNMAGQQVNVFGLGRNEMESSSLLAENREYGFRLKPAAETEARGPGLAELAYLLPAGTYSSAAEAIKAANVNLWKRYFDPRVNLLQLDDGDVADLVAAHLSDPASWLRSQFFYAGQFPAQVLGKIDRLAATPWRGWFKNSTHFFWALRGGRIVPLVLNGENLSTDDGQFKIGSSPEALAEGLRSRVIIPNLFTVFLVLAMLPGVRILGGSRQSVYFPLMRYALCAALADSGKDDIFLRTLLFDDRSGGWGHRVISAPEEPFQLLRDAGSGGFAKLLHRYGNMTLNRACGSMDSFLLDPLWPDLAGALRRGEISTTGGPWAFS